jgi:hypothetical protein
MKSFASPRPKTVNKRRLVVFLKLIQESAHDSYVSLESLQYAVDYFVFAALDTEGCARYSAAEEERRERERPAREAAAEASRIRLNELLGEGWEKKKLTPDA